LLLNQTNAATTPAAEGLGSPTNKRLSAAAFWELKRASLSAAATANRNATSQPTLPQVTCHSARRATPHWETRIACARPNDTISDSLSYSLPNCDDGFVGHA